jgi:hypothetical protein
LWAKGRRIREDRTAKQQINRTAEPMKFGGKGNMRIGGSTADPTSGKPYNFSGAFSAKGKVTYRVCILLKKRS